MSDSPEITRIILIKPAEEEERYIVGNNALNDCMASGDDLPAIHIGNNSIDFSYIRVNKTILSSPLSFFIFENDFFDYLDALKIKSVRHRNTWTDSPEADAILDDAEGRLHKYARTYPGLMSYIALAASYNGAWTEYLPPL